MIHLIQSAQHTLIQLRDFLQQIQEEDYVLKLPILFESSVGMQVRHVIEFYQCLLNGARMGTIDYDARERSLLLESDTAFAISGIDTIMAELSNINENAHVILLTEQHLSEEKWAIESNFCRELSYVIEHTVHHLAILKMGCMCAFDHIVFDKDFGIASSTVKFRERVYSQLPA